MPAVAALLERRSALAALRRPQGTPVIACRSTAALRRLLERRVVDAVVFAPQPQRLAELDELRADFPALPLVVYAPFRPDDGDLLGRFREHELAVVVEGVDDAVAGELVAQVSLTARRRAQLAEAPRALRLAEPLQRRLWSLLLREVETPARTTDLARRLGVTREHLSRAFAAGGAPNLKRVIDLQRVAAAAQLLQNPGYSATTVARLLQFATVAHLSRTARRIAGVSSGRLGELGPRGVLARFVRGKTRSRL